MKNELVSQYRAAMQMLINAIEKCPDHIWQDESPKNSFWRISYHTLHYTNFYSSKNAESFVPWINHIPNCHQLGKEISYVKPYVKAQLIMYAKTINSGIEQQIDQETFYEDSGFDWLKMNKLELHFYNIRHLQHHTGQLVERLNQSDIGGSIWIGQA